MLKRKLIESWNKLRRAPSGFPPIDSHRDKPSAAARPNGSNKVKDAALFAKEILLNPRAVGAALPSSARLSQLIAQTVPLDAPGLVLELGAGTGVVTEALLRRGLPPEKLVVVELSPNLAEHLRRRFPHLRIIEGDAVHLNRLLGESSLVSVIVSCLPLRSLPRDAVRRILRQFDHLLDHGGLLVQFTYDLRPQSHRLSNFTQISSFIVWQNVPPAKVMLFRHNGNVSPVLE
jgi:phospholipid N-methyltransferase